MQSYFNKPVFVLGLPRSGTSMIAGILHLCGAWVGSTVPAGAENPKGFFEHRVLRERVIKKILVSLGGGPLGVKKLPPIDIDIQIPGLSDVMKQVVENDGYMHDRVWLYKDAKLSLIWPVFREAFAEATWVIVDRDEEGFVDSCLRASFMRQHSDDPEFWRRLYDEYSIRLQQLQESGASVVRVSTPDIISGDFTELKNVIADLGLSYDHEKISDFITPGYWNRKQEH